MWIGIVKLSLLRTGYFSSAANVLTSSPKIWHVNSRHFFQLNLLGSDQWIWSRCCDVVFNSAWAHLQCCLSKDLLKRDFLEFVWPRFRSPQLLKYKIDEGHLFSLKYEEFHLHLKNAAKNLKKLFCFWENWIWIGIVKLSLLRTGYFSSAANVLGSSPKIWHVNKRDFLENKFLPSDQWIRQRCCDADFNSVWARLTYCFSKHPLKLDFLDIYLTTFSKSVTSKIQNLWGSSFYSKCLKFNLDLKNSAKN